ncbi:Hypothetical predicted protein [Lecanosticta acicola]|uniref:ADF-H domain-containing protein n=1 Tax=Lecanosticta acicola TaxID=111012 RepID=A0AAI8Z8L9_9PEZI|nr:Hypothetical predicted protein [Lecanosticta acicola]
MSLNGLDTPDVQDAYQTAVGEAGGWFLLKYVSRDAVELLGRGKNGVAEARNTIIAYKEPSPLYGLIIYRRRKILIKYIPEGTSRLLQARTAVHFQDVLERYSPYETLLDITTGEGLNDTALAASFHLHTASPSPSTKRLDEICEDGEDGGHPAALPSSANPSSTNLSSAQRIKPDRRSDMLRRRSDRTERKSSLNTELPRGGALDSHPLSAAPSQKPSMSQFLVREESGRTSITPLKPSFAETSAHEHRDSDISTKSADSTRKASDVPDSASQTTQDAGETTDATETSLERSPKPPGKDIEEQRDLRNRELPALPESPPPPPPKPSERIEKVEKTERTAQTVVEERPVKSAPPTAQGDDFDWKEYYDSMFTPKPKLGPRPVTSAEKTKRPVTARVCALPAHYKPGSKRQGQLRPKPAALEIPFAPTPPSVSTTALPVSTPIPAPPPIPHEPEYEARPNSRGSVKSTQSHKTMMTPDKLRLMKALELRKRQLRKSQENKQAKPPADEEVPDVPQVRKPLQPEPFENMNGEGNLGSARVIDDETHPQSAKADSGIEMQYTRAEGQRTEQQWVDTKQSQPAADSSEPYEKDTKPVEAVAQAGETSTLESEKPMEPAEPVESAESAEPVEPFEPAEQPEADEEDEDEDEAAAVPQIVVAEGSRPLTSDGQVRERKASSSRASSARRGGEAPSINETLEAPVSLRRQNSDLTKRRRGYVEPLQLEINSGNPDDFVSDDEDFLDELHSAKVQEARPILVSRSSNPKSPNTPRAFDRRPSFDTASVRPINITRTNNMPVERLATPDLPAPEAGHPARSCSTPPFETGDTISSYSRNVSSGISRRIQALAEKSSREAMYAEHSGRSTSWSRPNSFRRHSSNRMNQATAGTGSEVGQSPSWNVQHDPLTNRNSVSVTARIVRPAAVDEWNPDGAQLQQSELTINHQREPSVEDAPSSLNTSKANSAMTSPAISPILARFPAEVRTMHSAAATRLGRHRQGSTPTSGLDEFAPTPSSRGMSSASNPVVLNASNDENVAPHKEGGRTSRFFKRMSTFGGTKRKSGAQSGASTTSLASIASTETSRASQPAAQRRSSAGEKLDMPPAVVVGDLNVQFPDSLLWKRRIVTIDETGHLQFAIAQAMEIHKGVALKQYPLGEFKQPYAPDVDSEELPNSVVLELHDGTFLQTACEDGMTQRQVLHVLKSYWKAWTSSAA